jgi:uncharacterized cupin superfamily protein
MLLRSLRKFAQLDPAEFLCFEEPFRFRIRGTMTDENEPKQPYRPIRSEDVEWVNWSEKPGFGMRYRHLTAAAIGEKYKVGFAIEELAPGKQTVPFNYHLHEEEHVFVLSGEATLRLGSDFVTMKAGDYVCFPAGQRAGHCLINNSNDVCRYIIVGERNPDDVVIYPETHKVMVRALGGRQIFDMNAKRDYWDGEKVKD